MESWRALMFGLGLPLRIFLTLFSFIFNYPLIFGLIFIGVGGYAFTEARPNIGGLCVGMVGLLVIWFAEHGGGTAALRNPFNRADWVEA